MNSLYRGTVARVGGARPFAEPSRGIGGSRPRGADSMPHLGPWQVILAGITGTLALAAIYTALLTSDRQNGLIETTRYNRVFDASQAATELVRLEAAVGRYALAPSQDQRDEVKLRFAIMQNRIEVLQKGSVHALIDETAESRQDLVELTQATEAIGPLVDTIEVGENAKAILGILMPVEAPVLRLVSIANTVTADRVEVQRQNLRSVYWKGVWLTQILVMCGLILVVMLIRGNKRVHRLAHRDALTGLPNRLVFKAKLAALASVAGPADTLTVMLLDLDMFKHVNDTFGHAGGDALLQTLARRLECMVTDAVLVARLGGDEFAILLTSARAEAAAIAEQICRIGSRPFDLDGKSVSTSLSIGIVTAPAEPSDPETLFKHADVALYAAKAAGRATYRFFDPSMEEELRVRRDMEADLRTAIQTGGLDLAFQPIVDLATQRIVSCEALARWQHPTLGMIPPAEFIPLAEDMGLVGRLSEWVMERACATAMSWPGDIRVSVNLSPHQFNGTNLAETIRTILTTTGLRASRLELEITESVLLRDTDHVLQTLSDLKQLGARIALDDFGIGYSSLGYLQRFPIDKIKIDQSFVREITRNPESALIVESIGALANKLGLTTTAEGIETEAHAQLIGAMGYAEGQGYFFDRPLSAADCLARLTAQAMCRTAA